MYPSAGYETETGSRKSKFYSTMQQLSVAYEKVTDHWNLNLGRAMCRSKDHPNYYRCEWGQQSTSAVWLDAVIDAGNDTSVSVMANVLDGHDPDALDELRAAATKAVRDVLAERSPGDLKQAAKALHRPRGHVLCGLLAAIGKACSEISGIPDDIAEEVKRLVTQATGSRLVGSIVKSVADQFLEFASTALAPIDQIEAIADMLAVDTCPAQPESPKSHPETEEAAQRLESELVGAALTAIMDPANSRN